MGHPDCTTATKLNYSNSPLTMKRPQDPITHFVTFSGGYRFAEADTFVAEHDLVGPMQYEQTKANYLLDYFRIKRGQPIETFNIYYEA
jgi:hypothetical protein